MASSHATISQLIGTSAQVTRASLPYGAASIVGLGTHVGLLALFTAFGVWPMAAINVASVACFVVVRWLFLTQRLTAGMVVAVAEVVAHQVLAVSFCGWEPGFQYYLLCVVPLCQMLPGASQAVRYASSALPPLTFVALAFLAPASPSHAFPRVVAAALGVTNLMISFGVCWVFIHFYRSGAESSELALGAAWDRTERLLHGILPPSIVDRLREKPGVVADRFESTSVLFADLVGFTPLAQKKSPEALVVLLDEVFATFDDLAEARGLEKIKTIGDAYMVASGVPAVRAEHTSALADFALEARDSLAKLSARVGEPLALRIGIHTGPVVAGVIGKTKFAYDLWGDAVNIAARMESHGEPGKIHVSKAVADALDPAFVLEARGMVEVKGKGPMQTFWLIGRRGGAPPGSAPPGSAPPGSAPPGSA